MHPLHFLRHLDPISYVRHGSRIFREDNKRTFPPNLNLRSYYSIKLRTSLMNETRTFITFFYSLNYFNKSFDLKVYIYIYKLFKSLCNWTVQGNRSVSIKYSDE